MSALTWVGIVVGVVLLVGFLVVAFSDWGPEVPDWLRDLVAALRWQSGVWSACSCASGSGTA